MGHRDEKEITIGDIVQKLVKHGHNKREVIEEYSREECLLFYEKCIKEECAEKADGIEEVLAGIGGAFGGNKEITDILKTLRK